MNKLFKWCAVLTFLLAAVLACSISASAAYEPDGTSSTEYLFDAAECNRTLVLRCVDESGNLLKQVNFETKRGEDAVATVHLYGYDMIAFDSDQGLWEKCKMTWVCGTGLAEYCTIQMAYHFYSPLSQSVMTATATLRRSEPITLVERHFHQVRQQSSGFVGARLHDSSSQVVDYYTYVSTSSNNYQGYTLRNGYASRIEGTLSYTWLGNYVNIPRENLEYDYVNTTWSEDMGEYKKYDETKDGKLDYCINRVYYIDYYYDLNQYTAKFSANGGSGAPGNVTLYYGFTLTFPDTVPTRTGYFFKGWSTSSNASYASYVAGDSYVISGNVTFYAVWEKDDYEFSVSELTIDREEIFLNSSITVSVRTDNWDDDEAYTNIPMELYYDGELLATQSVDFAVYGLAWITFEIDVGTVIGEHEIKVQINRTGMAREENQDNNTVSMTVTVKNDEYAFGITPIENNAPYTEGMTVITSYLISNDSDRMVLPDVETPVMFTAYYSDGDGNPFVVAAQNWNGLAIPVEESNLVYFKWTVPDDLAGITVHCRCEVNAGGELKENNRENNVAVLDVVIADRAISQTPNPSFAANAPNGYVAQSAPSESEGSASWTVWEYEDGEFSLVEYGIRVADNVPSLSPGYACETALYENGIWRIKSGYGVTMYYAPDTTSVDGYRYPVEYAITQIQTVTAHFPEYGYSAESEEFRSLEYVNGVWRFAENLQADGNERVHYIPVWIEDGNYTVSVTVENFWTPVGMISCTRSTIPVVIEGTVFDDYYVGV